MPLKRLFAFLLTLPCLALSANEVGLESTNPSRFGAKFVENNGKVAAEFNDDHGVFAFFSFSDKGEWSAEALVTMPTGKSATLTGKIAGKAFNGSAKVEGTGKAEWISLGSFAALADAPAFLQLEAKERKGSVTLHGYRFTCATNTKAKATAVPLLHLKTAYTESPEISVGDRGGVGAATIQKAGGRLLIPVVVEKPGVKKLSVRFTANKGSTATLAVHVVDNLKLDALKKAAKVSVQLTGTGKPAVSKEIALTFPAAGTYLVALDAQEAAGTVTLNGLLLIGATNPEIWAIPNGNAQSVHFGYALPKGETALWAYAEAKSLPGPPTTYNCVLGFGHGYFGFQRKTAGPETKERVFIYSLWDNGYVKNDAKKVSAEELRDLVVTTVAKGEGVNASAFDHEGSGGHSDLPYAWKDNATYSFLLGVKADGDAAVYSAWVKLAETGQWRFLTSFRRPKTVAKIDGLYSFVEDWSGSYGQVERKCLYSNLWIRNSAGKWIALKEAKSSATSELGRKDFNHTVEGNAVALITGGYSSTDGKRGVVLAVPAGKEPSIELDKLPTK
ncbi:MAG: DUF3472 domain-containing protein [Verrucomicrobia bacterium]|nr:DUF3472 domain-containing protein [Verrucomicrobiota bacterium]